MNNPTPLHFYRTKGKNVCVLMLLCVPLSMMDIPGPCKHAITMDHLLQLKQLISNQLRTGCSITYTFIERKHLSVVCYVKAALPRVLELFNVHFKYVRGSGSAQAVVSIQNLILNIYSQHCIPSLDEQLEEDPVAFEGQYNESPVQALQRVEEVLSLYLHLITTTNTPVNWTCEQEYSSNLPPTATQLTTNALNLQVSTHGAAIVFSQATTTVYQFGKGSRRHGKCFVVGSTDEHRTLFRVPASEETREQWIY
uniref:Colony stimulating factor 1b (macrophage) n=1 Tax=Sinocyclocheilus grahami TaxID=75366 RepID=A0A672TCT8_SINGR